MKTENVTNQSEVNVNIRRWYGTSVLLAVAVVFLLATGKLTIADITSDVTFITPLICLAFIYFFSIHIFNFVFSVRENRLSREILDNAEDLITPDKIKKIDGLSGWYYSQLTKAYDNMGEGEIYQADLAEVLASKFRNRESIVVLGSNIMITLGLIGTVAGLVIAVAGLENILDGLKGDTNKLIESLKVALSGMHIAFYTTLFGAVLGGVFLKLQLNYTNTINEETVDNITTVAAVHLLPRLKKSVDTAVTDLAEAVKKAQEAVTLSAKEVASLLSEARKSTEKFTILGDAIDRNNQILETIAKVIPGSEKGDLRSELKHMTELLEEISKNRQERTVDGFEEIRKPIDSLDANVGKLVSLLSEKKKDENVKPLTRIFGKDQKQKETEGEKKAKKGWW